MADIQLTDDLGKAAPDVKIDLSQPSSLLKYAKAELLHLAVAPDFIARAPQLLTAAAPDPISFQLKLQHEFKLGNTKPAIDLTPLIHPGIRANTTKGANLFDDEPFGIACTVPEQTGYVSLELQGALDLGVSGSSGDLTFGIDGKSGIAFGYCKAFPLGAGEPTLGDATGQAISGFVIPASVDDLKLLGVNDVCTVSGQGSLKIAGGFSVTAAPNPLASVALPLNAGTVAVQTGVVAGISASFTITGSYQVRARRTSNETIEISFYRQRGTALTTDLSASGGVSVTVGSTELLAALIGAITTNPTDDAIQKLFGDGGLSADEVATLTGAIKGGLDHSLQASLDLALSQATDDGAAFQYEIRPALLDAAAGAAVEKALRADLSGLTALELGTEGAQLAPGVKLLSSVLTTMRKNQAVFRLNLLGVVNFISLSELIRQCVVVKDPGTGYLTITDSATGKRINAEVEPDRHSEALREVMFESMMVTATYRVSNTVNMPGLSSHNFHFAFHAATSAAELAEYLKWCAAMNLMNGQEMTASLKQFQGGGASTCLIRTEFDDDACRSLFFQSPNQLWDMAHYQDVGRRAMRALIDPSTGDKDKYRYALLDQHWAEAASMGPVDGLAGLVGLHLTQSNGAAITPYLRGDVYTINWWAGAMVAAGKEILAMQQFLAGADPAKLAGSAEFDRRRDQLQKKMAGVIADSRTRFDEPWGLVTLFWAAGSRGASARVVANGVLLQRP